MRQERRGNAEQRACEGQLDLGLLRIAAPRRPTPAGECGQHGVEGRGGTRSQTTDPLGALAVPAGGVPQIDGEPVGTKTMDEPKGDEREQGAWLRRGGVRSSHRWLRCGGSGFWRNNPYRSRGRFVFMIEEKSGQ
jgi:hypothetical protein